MQDRNYEIHRRALIAAGAAWAADAAVAAAASGVGVVEGARGDVAAELAGVRRGLAEGGAVYLGDLVRTGEAARVLMRLGEATRISLGANAALRIDKFVAELSGDLKLLDGPLLFDRPESAGKIKLKLRSPFARIAVRGTTFFAGPLDGVFAVFVERGEVNVRAGNELVVLAAGDGVDVAKPGGTPGPVKRWGKARIERAMASVA